MNSFREIKMRYLNETNVQLKKAQDFMNGTVFAVKKIPQYFQWCCCFYCYRKRKSIGVVQENNNSNSKGTPVIPITIAPEVNKPPQQQQQQQIYHSPSDSIHHHHEQLNGRSRQVEEIKKIETLSKTAPEQHETPTNDNQMRLQNSLNSLHKDKDPLSNGGGGGGAGSDGGYIIESSELSSEDRLSSGHSTPTRVLGEMVTPTSVKSDLGRISRTFSSKSVQNISAPPSRSQSFSNVDYENKIISAPLLVNKNQFESNEDNLSHNNKEEEGNNKCKEEEIYIVEEIPENTAKDVNKLIDMQEILNTNGKSPEKHIQDQSKIEEMITKATDYNEENIVTIAEKSIEETVAAVVDENETTLLEVQAASNDIVDFISSSSKEDSVTQNAESKEEGDKEQEDDEELQTVYESKDIIKSFQPISSSSSPIPTMEVKPITREFSIAKSSDLLFEPSSVKPELDTKSITSTEASSDYQLSHTTSLDDGLPNDFMVNKPRHIPLMRKSKTTLFGRNRRVSPVKQSIKLSKAEVFPQTLTKYDRPKEAFNQSIAQLDSPDWETVIQGLRSFVRLMRYHPELLDLHMHMVCIQLAKTARNLRSQVARAACQASTELFTIRSKHLEQECDDLVGSLLHRTADTNRFLRADATRALESMCDNLMPSKILHILTNRGAVHQNAMVRTSTAKLLNRLADRIGCDRIYSMNRENRDKFIITGANLLLEGSLETRSYAKALFRLLSNHHSYSRLLLEVIPSKTYRNIEKTLKSIQ